ncbi:MAG TPA: DUF2975 domain-containing protein [Candidatus Angelobacter sp.]|nr:DUF2975 domain-containing protein [Candidatus Angelobacter sp.]
MTNISLPKFLKWLFGAFEITVAVWAIVNLARLAIVVYGTNTHSESWWSLGGIGFRIDSSAYHLVSPTINPSALSIRDVFGSVGIKFSEAGPLIRSLFWPLIGVLLSKTLAIVALCDLLRRMFRSVERREVFSAGNIRNLQKIGVLIIALTVAIAFFERSYGVRTVEFINKNITVQGTVAIEIRLQPPHGMTAGNYWIHGFLVRIDEDQLVFGFARHRDFFLLTFDPRGIFLGLVLIGLGEALRQGLALKEENELTV